MIAIVATLTLGAVIASTEAIGISPPETVIVHSGDLSLRALVWRPRAPGRFPAVLLNHGSYSTDDPLLASEPETLGPVFARHGYVFMFLFRQGTGLSAGQGVADLDQMQEAFASGGQDARNEIQLRLLETEQLAEARAGLDWLLSQPMVNSQRIAVVGHSFGGSLSLIQSENEPAIRALVLFAPGSLSWDRSSQLRERIRASLARLQVPVLLIYAQNDYSLGSAKALPAELETLGKTHELRLYPPIGTTQRDGHNLLYRSVPTWEADVFAFLDRVLQRGQSP